MLNYEWQVRRGLGFLTTLILGIVLAACSASDDPMFTFVIDRNALLDALKPTETSMQIVVTADGQKSDPLLWDESDDQDTLTFKVLGAERSAVEVHAFINQMDVGGSLVSEARQGSRVCLFSTETLDQCKTMEPSGCLCAGARLCRGAADSTTLALYDFDTPPNELLAGNGYGVDDTGRYPAELQGNGTALVRDDLLFYCDSGGSLTRENDLAGVYLQIYPHSRMENSTALDDHYSDLRWKIYAVEFAAYLRPGAPGPQTVIAAESVTDDSKQFEVAIMPNGDLRLHLIVDGTPGFYCASRAIAHETWTEVAVNLRNLVPQAFVRGREVEIDQSGKSCESGFPGSISISNDPLNESAQMTIGVSFRDGQGTDWLGPSLRIDQLRLLNSRL